MVIYRTVISCAYLCKHLPGIFISSAVFLYGQWSTHKWSKYQKAMSTVRPLPLITGVLPAPPRFCQVDDHLFISSSVFWSISIHIIYIIHIIPTYSQFDTWLADFGHPWLPGHFLPHLSSMSYLGVTYNHPRHSNIENPPFIWESMYLSVYIYIYMESCLYIFRYQWFISQGHRKPWGPIPARMSNDF